LPLACPLPFLPKPMITSSSALTKPKVCETQRVRLTSRLLHIGSAVSQLSPFEYVQTGSAVYLPNQEALARLLKERGFLNSYIQRIEDREEIVTLLEDALGDGWLRAKDAAGEAIFPSHYRIRKWVEGAITDLRPMIRNGFGCHYIPGSSIKGAIRTAITYHLLKHADQYQVPQQQRVSSIESQLRKSMGELKYRAKFFDDRLLMDPLFTDFTLKGNRGSDRTGPNTDFMRAVHVSDSVSLAEEKIERPGKPPIPRNLPVAAEVIVSSRFNDYRAKYRASLYVEMLFNVSAEFTLSVDHKMLAGFRHNQSMKIPFSTVEDLLKICQEFAQEQWDFEHDYWNAVQDNPKAGDKTLNFSHIRDLYEPERCPHTLRLGWASGLRGTTINLLMPEDLVAEVRDTCGIQAPGFEAPKSRRTVVSPKGEIRYVPSWAKLEVMRSGEGGGGRRDE
jgi:CRISPR-associated protein Csm5